MLILKWMLISEIQIFWSMINFLCVCQCNNITPPPQKKKNLSLLFRTNVGRQYNAIQFAIGTRFYASDTELSMGCFKGSMDGATVLGTTGNTMCSGIYIFIFFTSWHFPQTKCKLHWFLYMPIAFLHTSKVFNKVRSSNLGPNANTRYYTRHDISIFQKEYRYVYELTHERRWKTNVINIPHHELYSRIFLIIFSKI